MPRDPLQNVLDQCDVVVIGGGLGGMTAGNILARAGRRVILAEQRFKLGGLATWFRRGERIF
ncbi:MAG: FAD-dependent oxidoreductase, partial [Pirellulales bacterium]|nr:FAD-dependent oxidoreductase [Pirellulales bacterium]